MFSQCEAFGKFLQLVDLLSPIFSDFPFIPFLFFFSQNIHLKFVSLWSQSWHHLIFKNYMPVKIAKSKFHTGNWKKKKSPLKGSWLYLSMPLYPTWRSQVLPVDGVIYIKAYCYNNICKPCYTGMSMHHFSSCCTAMGCGMHLIWISETVKKITYLLANQSSQSANFRLEQILLF